LINKVVPLEQLDEAVALALEMAPPGGAVLLSPAHASYGMFRNYHERGLAFRKAVEADSTFQTLLNAVGR